MYTYLNYLLLTVAFGSILAANQEQPSRFKLRNARTSRTLTVGNATVVEVAPPIASNPVPVSPVVASNRTTRTADLFQNGDGYNIFVTNTCEKESMKVTIKTSRPFYGTIHTSNQRKKARCTTEGNGDDEYSLEISNVLNQTDPAYCGVIRAQRESSEDKDILSLVVVVRAHRNIELADDKFFLLNCTNRCRFPDCSSRSSKLIETEDSTSTYPEENAKGNGSSLEECSIWRFPWIITLLWCLGILLLAMIISHCIMCSSLVCRCVKTEVEEKEPSVYEGATDFEDDQYNKRHPYRIEYDNKDIYKTSNNYEPYCLEETQTKTRHKSRHNK